MFEKVMSEIDCKVREEYGIACKGDKMKKKKKKYLKGAGFEKKA